MNLPQQKNSLLVVGFLKSKFLEHKQINNQDTIVGNIVVSFKDNQKRTNNHRINIFAPEKTKSGNTMPSYKSASALEGFKSIDEYKEEKEKSMNPDDVKKPVRISVKGSLDYNVYTDKNEQVHKNLRLSGDFFSRVNDADQDTVDQAKAELEITVTGYQPELKNDEPTGNQFIKNLNVGYNDFMNTIPDLKFDMNELGDSINDIINYFPVGKTMPIQINLQNYMEETQTEEESHGFGTKTQITTANRFVRNNLISYVSTDQPKVTLNNEQLNKATQLLNDKGQSELNNKINSFNNYNNSGNQKQTQSATDSNEGVELSDEDFPF